jgi:desampylase
MVARVSISSALLDELQAASAASPGAEICGLLYGRPDAIFMAEACANVAPTPDRAFELDPAALIAAHRRARAGGPAIIGHYHSHPSGRAEPSAIDAEAAPPDGALWLILTAGEARLWRATPDGAWHGRFDPVPLAIDAPCDAPPPSP